MKYILIILIGLFGWMNAHSQNQSGTFKDLQIGATTRVNLIKTLIGVDSIGANKDKKLLTAGGVYALVKDTKTGIYAYINTADTIYLAPGLDFVAGKITINPGVSKETHRRVTTQNFTIGATDVNIKYEYSGGGGTITLPSLNVDTDGNVYYIHNISGGTLTYNNAVWTDNATSVTTLATGKIVKLVVDNNLGKIWAYPFN